MEAQGVRRAIKMPYENRPENRKTRQAMDSIMETLNECVEEIHDHYTEAIEEWREEGEALLKAIDNGASEAVEVFGGDALRRMVDSMRSF